MLRKVYGHPVLPNEDLELTDVRNAEVDFRLSNNLNFKNKLELAVYFEVIDQFSLKYLGKFVTEYQI